MNSRKKSLRRSLCAAILLGMTTLCQLQAQDQPVQYTRVAQWQIERQHWDAYEKDFKKNAQPVLEKLVADGVITEFGSDRTTIHAPDSFSHATWWSGKTQAAVEQALEALVASEAKLSPEERKRQDTDFAGTRHADLLLRSILYKSRTVKADRGYGIVSATKVQSGKAQEWQALWDKYTKPVYEKLYADGTVTGYGIDVEQVHTGDPGMRYAWHIVPNAEALDKVNAAFEAVRQKSSPEERRAIGRMFAEVSEGGAHRDHMSQIIAYSAKQ